MRPSVPPYFDQLLAARRAGYAGRDVHLGYWDDPPSLFVPCELEEFTRAQGRLTERIVELAALAANARVLDVGCGLGGTLDVINARLCGMALTGLNIDARQLRVCREIAPCLGNHLDFVEADACHLPFPAACFDHVLCVEAIFHFASRATFLTEAARTLRAGGRLVLSDIAIRDPGLASPWEPEVTENALRRDYGPWPEIWFDAGALAVLAQAAGLTLLTIEDWSRETLPGYRVTAPLRGPEPSWNPAGGEAMRWLHVNGWLSYVAAVFARV